LEAAAGAAPHAARILTKYYVIADSKLSTITVHKSHSRFVRMGGQASSRIAAGRHCESFINIKTHPEKVIFNRTRAYFLHMNRIALPVIIFLLQTFIVCADTTFAWGALFVPERMENGDTVSIGAMAASGDTIFLYDIPANRIILISSNLAVLKTVTLTGSPRKGWAGDDFVVTRGEFVFLCAQDRTLDQYDRFTGKLVARTTIPQSLLASEDSRSARLLSRIFFDNSELFVGNTRAAVAFSPGLSKARGLVRRPGPGKRIGTLQSGRVIETRENRLLKQRGASSMLPIQQYEIPGKRMALTDSTFSWIATCTRKGISLTRIPLQ
jgi:hypothetical protein